MVPDAFHLDKPERFLLPYNLLVSKWQKQPPDHMATVPTLPDVHASTTQSDKSLKLPVTASKRGRPNTKRKRSAVKLVARRERKNADH